MCLLSLGWQALPGSCLSSAAVEHWNGDSAFTPMGRFPAWCSCLELRTCFWLSGRRLWHPPLLPVLFLLPCIQCLSPAVPVPALCWAPLAPTARYSAPALPADMEWESALTRRSQQLHLTGLILGTPPHSRDSGPAGQNPVLKAWPF